MGNVNFKYAAFISYRHTDLDKKWAKWLVDRLERYRIPKDLVEAGFPQKLGKVYRDEDEFAAAPDLHQHIKDALDVSSHLIVICSKNTPASKWVDQEIAYFRSIGRGAKILALLVEGEPEESFPEALWQLDEASNRVEPAAADVRSSPGQRQRETKDTALMRLTASLIGCSFDKLRNREKLKTQRRRFRAVAGMLGVLLAFVGLFGWQKNDAYRNQRQKNIESLDMRSELLGKLSTSADREFEHIEAMNLNLESVNLLPSLIGDRSISIGYLLANLGRQKEVFVLKNSEQSLRHSHLNPQATHIVSASINNDILVSAVGTGKLIRNIKFIENGPRSSGSLKYVFFNSDGTKIIAYSGKTTRIYETITGSELWSFEAQYWTDWPNFLVSTDEEKALIVSADSYRLVNFQNGKKLYEFNKPSLSVAGSLSPNGKMVATEERFGNGKAVIFWDAENGKELKRLNLERWTNASKVVFSPNEKYIAIAMYGAMSDGNIQIWDTKTWTHISTLNGHRGSIRSLDFDADSERIASAGKDGTVRLWVAKSGHELAQFKHNGEVRAVSFNQTGELLLSTSSDGTTRIWDVSSRDKFNQGIVLRQNGLIYPVSYFNENESLILTASYDQATRIWDLEKHLGNNEIAKFGHGNFVNSASFNSDGTQIITAANQGKILLIDVTTQEIKSQFSTNRSSSAFFSPNGKFIVISSGKRAEIWDIEQEKKYELYFTVNQSQRQHSAMMEQCWLLRL